MKGVVNKPWISFLLNFAAGAILYYIISYVSNNYVFSEGGSGDIAMALVWGFIYAFVNLFTAKPFKRLIEKIVKKIYPPQPE